MHVAERRRKEVAAALSRPKCLGDREPVFHCAVKPFGRAAGRIEAVLLPAYDADLHLKHEPELCRLGKELPRLGQVVGQRQRRAVEHVRIEKRRFVPLPPRSRLGKQRPEEIVHPFRRAVIGMEGHQHWVARREDVRELRESTCSRGCIADGTTGGESCSGRRHLNYPV